MTQTITTANIYALQDNFDSIATKTMTDLDIDKETFAELCLSWIRQNAKWDDHENTSDRIEKVIEQPQEPKPQVKDNEWST